MATRTDYRSRLERAVVDIIARAILVFPFAWLAMLVGGALGSRMSYWEWVLPIAAGSLVIEGVRGLWRRFRKRGGRRG